MAVSTVKRFWISGAWMRVSTVKRWRGSLLASVSILLAGSLAYTDGSAAPATGTQPILTDTTKTIGLVLTVWDSAILETPEAHECPEGLHSTETEQWLAMSEQERAEQNKRFGFRWNRGPNGENGITAPAAVTDILPFREIRSELAYGFNLDGTQDGRATAKSCAHEKFNSPDGNTKVDHQLYRAAGCAQGMRIGGFQREWVAREFQTNPVNRTLILVTGVDDELNDEEVVLSVYKGYDGLVEEPIGTFLPNSTHHVDERFPSPLFSTPAKIEDGVIITDVVTRARFPILWIQIVGWRTMLDMQMRLKLTETGAKGMLGGYEEIEEFWNMWRRGASGSQDISSWSGATIYHAIRRLADGYPDPETGKCTAISTAYRLEAATTNIILPAGRGDLSLARGDIATHPARHELFGF